MKLTKVTEDIFKYDNFLTQEECEKTINLLKKYEEEDSEYWKAISFYESYSAMYPQDNDPILEKFGLPGNWFSDLERRFKQCAADLAGLHRGIAAAGLQGLPHPCARRPQLRRLVQKRPGADPARSPVLRAAGQPRLHLRHLENRLAAIA